MVTIPFMSIKLFVVITVPFDWGRYDFLLLRCRNALLVVVVVNGVDVVDVVLAAVGASVVVLE